MTKKRPVRKNLKKVPERFRKLRQYRLKVIEQANKRLEAEIEKQEIEQKMEKKKRKHKDRQILLVMMSGVRKVQFNEKNNQIHEFERWIEQKQFISQDIDDQEFEEKDEPSDQSSNQDQQWISRKKEKKKSNKVTMKKSR